MQRAGPAEPQAKVAAIQALRAIAALSVAIVHLTYGFARHVDGRLAWLPEGDQLAQGAVALFFVISGCVMVLSSERLFGTPRGTLTFWRRRAVRVLPPYWLASTVLAGVLVALGREFDAGFAVRSLAFIPEPADSANGVPFALFLWPGWTLFYELLFYALFGAFVAFGRVRAVVLTALALGALVVAGLAIGSDRLAVFAVTRPIVLLFVVGMLFGLALQRGWSAPGWSRWGALVIALAVAWFMSDPKAPLGWGYLAWAGVPAVLLFLAVLAGPLRLPFEKAFMLLGDASYAIYLLHVPFAHAWMRVFNQWWDHPGGSLGFLALGVPLLVALSLAFHRWVERPLTGSLNRLLGDRASPPGDLPRTLAP